MGTTNSEKMLTSFHLLTGPLGIAPICERNEGEPLGPPRVPVLRQKHPRDPSKALKHIPQVVLLGKLGHIGDPESGQVVPVLEAPTHGLPCALFPAQVRRHIAPLSHAKPTNILSRVPAVSAAAASATGRTNVVERREGILEGTTSGEMVALADTTGDFLILQLVAQRVLLFILLLVGALPVGARAEDDVFADGGCAEVGPADMAFLGAEFGPFFALGDARVHVLFDNGGADLARGLDLFVGVVEAVGYDGLGAVGVGDDLLLWEDGGIVEFLVVGPVGSSVWGVG